jgi:Ner family transcriptional regulator
MRRTDTPWYRVKADLAERGYTLVDVAQKMGITRFTVCNAKYRPVATVQRVIAEILGRTPQDIWPTRYTVDGRPVLRVVWLKSNAAGVSGHGLKRRAA